MTTTIARKDEKARDLSAWYYSVRHVLSQVLKFQTNSLTVTVVEASIEAGVQAS
jgi:hypothetical protein